MRDLAPFFEECRRAERRVRLAEEWASLCGVVVDQLHLPALADWLVNLRPGDGGNDRR